MPARGHFSRLAGPACRVSTRFVAPRPGARAAD